MTQLEDLIRTVHYAAPAWIAESRFQVREAQARLAKGDTIQAVALAQTALESSTISNEDAFRAFDVLSGSTTNPTEQIHLLEQALQQAEVAHNINWTVRLYTYIGLAYRRQGKWQEAENAYRQALHRLDEQQDSTQYANTLNNLAFVRMLKGDLDGADNAADRALRIRKRESNIYGLALSYSTKGRIAEEKGLFADAQRFYHTSVNLFESLGKFDDAASRKISLASSARAQQNFSEAHRLLHDGLKSENISVRAVALYHQAKVFREEARVLNEQSGAAEQVQTLYQRAHEAGSKALAYAHNIQDAFLKARILLDMALNTLFQEQREDTERIEQLQEILKEYNFVREQGRLTELQGDLAYVQQDYATAFACYLDACTILSGHSKIVFEQSFGRIRHKFLDLPVPIQEQICQLITERCASDEHIRSSLTAMKKLCDDVLEVF